MELLEVHAGMSLSKGQYNEFVLVNSVKTEATTTRTFLERLDLLKLVSQ